MLRFSETFLYGAMALNGIVVVGLLFWNWHRGDLAAIDDTSPLLFDEEDKREHST